MIPLGGIQRVVGYTTAILFLGLGILMMLGILVPQFGGGVKFRILFGLVIFLYGAFRLTMVITRSR
jgi:hypothetical protein